MPPKSTSQSDGTVGSYISHTNTVLEQLRSESDRGAALIGMAYLDNLLEKLVRARMIDEEKHLDQLLDYPGPLCTANARTALAYALGWIGPQNLKDLSTVRRIRNKFAHSCSGLPFESDQGIIQLCRNLKAAEFAGYRLRLSRDRFFISVVFLGLQLTELCRKSQKPSVGTDPPIHKLSEPVMLRNLH
jgi:DNA-binding MltR family transcriptional regulator